MIVLTCEVNVQLRYDHLDLIDRLPCLWHWIIILNGQILVLNLLPFVLLIVDNIKCEQIRRFQNRTHDEEQHNPPVVIFNYQVDLTEEAEYNRAQEKDNNNKDRNPS